MFPACYMETSSNEINEYYQPKDFKVGDTIFIYGRRFLLLDCDSFTRKYYSDILKMAQGNKLMIKFPTQTQPKKVKLIVIFNNGSLLISFAVHCLHIVYPGISWTWLARRFNGLMLWPKSKSS